MLAATILLAHFALGPSNITRNEYGVPTIKAASITEAYELAGYATAQDRLWQMEMSRRIAQGQMSEVFGSKSLSSDAETLKLAYTPEELQGQIDTSGTLLKSAYEAYARGVNKYIADATGLGTLPEGYAKNKLTPRPWTPVDSAAIAIMMAQRFGSGAVGELRNNVALAYLKTQPCRAQLLDVVDDIAWQNDPSSPTTVRKEDEGQCKPIAFPTFGRADTERQLKELPAINLLEAMGAIKLSVKEEEKEIAMVYGAPYKVGSYAVVVDAAHSAIGVPLLMSAPQMGFSNPSVVHEMVIDCPEMKVCGLDVPGMPGVLIGYTPKFAWGLTSGVADGQDIFVNHITAGDSYEFGRETRKITRIERTIKVAGGSDRTVTSTRTHFGPVILESKTTQSLYSQKSVFFGRELKSMASMLEVPMKSNGAELHAMASKIDLTFNMFFATNEGEIGWAYCGAMPIRAANIDPRFPTLGRPENDWKGTVQIADHVKLLNPKGGLITNWNNKPISWWPNLDTPVWGNIFRVSNVNQALPARPITTHDLEHVGWTIARMDDATCNAFLPDMKAMLAKTRLGETEKLAAKYITGWDGLEVEGSQGATVYEAWITELRKEIFKQHTGNFVNDNAFELVMQPSLIQKALAKKTKYAYLGKRTKDEVLLASFRKAVAALAQRGPAPTWRFSAWNVNWPNGNGFAYANRGTFIQIVELGKMVSGRTVNPPGIAESGAHSNDQTALAQGWLWKNSVTWGK
jgi:penicillin amidase